MTWEEAVRVLNIKIKEVREPDHTTISIYIPSFDKRGIFQFNNLDYRYREAMIHRIIKSTEMELWLATEITIN